MVTEKNAMKNILDDGRIEVKQYTHDIRLKYTFKIYEILEFGSLLDNFSK